MTELEQIDAAWGEASSRGDSGVLATVVRVQGSTYRRAGARLLLTTGGRRVGSVSGGCLEADLVKKAWWLTADGKCAIRHYDTSVEGEIAQEFGLGCNGVIHVLLERLEHSAVSALAAAQPVRRSRAAAVIATVVAVSGSSGTETGQRYIRFPDGGIQTNLADPELISFLDSESMSCSEGPPTHVVWEHGGESVDLFIETIHPGLRLLIFGAGDDAIPMVRQARLLGYETVVADGRSHLARKERFIEADGVEAAAPEDMLARVALDDWTAVILMSHSYAQDLAALSALSVGHKVPYIGALGPRKRTEKMLSELESIPEWLLDVLHSPVGLDIGADGPEQIALAAVAEIQAALNRRAGGLLRKKAGPIHPAPPQAADTYVPVACSLD
jgi:xanthine dehydrogenase accessory factor